jgi:hypothetical protein
MIWAYLPYDCENTARSQIDQIFNDAKFLNKREKKLNSFPSVGRKVLSYYYDPPQGCYGRLFQGNWPSTGVR